jgi:hypothetical protein
VKVRFGGIVIANQQPNARVSTGRWNLNEIPGKAKPRGTRISLGITNMMRLQNKSKSKDYTEVGM